MRANVMSQPKTSQPSSWGGSERRIGVTKEDRAAIAQAVVAAMVEDPSGGIRAAAKSVGISKSSLYRLMNEYAEVGDQIRAAQVCFRGAGQMIRELVGDDDDLIPHGREIHAPLSINGRRAALENMRAREQADQARADREARKLLERHWAERARSPQELAAQRQRELAETGECDDSEFWRGILGR
jgi:hypothetical protein